MLLLIVAYLGGVLTILSPCILPVLPFVFASAGRPFRSHGLPLLLGMALAFAAVATLAAVGGGWVVAANQYGRYAAIAMLALFGLALLVPSLAQRMSRPLVALGLRLASPGGSQSSVFAPLLLGVGTGLLWAPCAGPILGLILTGAALNGASIGTSLLLLAYAVGACTSLAAALLFGGRLFAMLKGSLRTGEWVRRGAGVAVLSGVGAIASGLDTGLLSQLSFGTTSALEKALVEKVGTNMPSAPRASFDRSGLMLASTAAPRPALALRDEGAIAPLAGATEWINSPPLTAESLRGKVVLVDFWTYSCINCLRTLPHVRQWYERYREHGLVVVGVHAPEFAFERDVRNVQRAVEDLGVGWPVALDNDFAIWRGFDNRYWPAHYFIDAQGRIRAHHFGEGNYEESEQIIRRLLREAGNTLPGDASAATAIARGAVERAPDMGNLRSPETYIGHSRAENFASPGGQRAGSAFDYAVPPVLRLNQWALGGRWVVGEEDARLQQAGGRIAFRFHARDLHLVLAPQASGQPVRFRVRVDGHAPGAMAGADVSAGGDGQVDENRLYQLIRQDGEVGERSFEIEFLDPGVHAYAFTFG